ncbi:MAG: POTRA domain-containing protein [Bryobacteraceae bacterium]
MIWLVLLLMCGSAAGIPAASAQTRRAKPAAAAKPSRWPIHTLTVEGNHNYTREQVLAVAGLKVGQMAGKEDFEAARERLIATGVFETVGYKFAPDNSEKGYAASFQVVEVEPAYPIRFERLGVPDQDITAYLKSKDPLFAPRLAATKAVLERYTRWVQEAVTAHDGKDKVVAKMTPLAADQFVIVFRPARSEPSVAEVIFEGNEVIPLKTLQNAIADVAVGMPYTEDQFRQALDAAIRPLYDARGRIRVTFPKIAVQKAADVDGLAVKVTVKEGPSYDLGDVRIEGASGFKLEDLQKAAKFKSGDLANFDDIGKGVYQIKKLLSQQGFIHSDIQIVRNVDDSQKKVSLVLQVNKGPQFVVGTVAIEGLDLNGEAAIRKMWTLKEGKPFNPDYPNYFLNRIKEEGVFDNLGDTLADTKVHDDSQTVDITLTFKGGKPPEKKKEQQSF